MTDDTDAVALHDAPGESPPLPGGVADIVNAALRRVLGGGHLSAREAAFAFNALFAGDQGGYLWLALSTALHARGETLDELVGLCESIEAQIGERGPLAADLDFNGSGRRPFPTINVGTASSVVAAAVGIPVAKHGSGAVTGGFGAMDLASALGLARIWPRDAGQIGSDLKEHRVTFVHNFLRSGLREHTRVAYLQALSAAGVRITSPFHLVGGVPQVVPTRFRVYGIYDPTRHNDLARLLQDRHAGFAVVTGHDGLDELSVTAPSTVTFSRAGGTPRTETVHPSDWGAREVAGSAVVVHDVEERIGTFLRVLRGEQVAGSSELVVGNAALGLWISSFRPSLLDAADAAREALYSGAAWNAFAVFTEESGNGAQLRDWAKRHRIAVES